MASGSAQRRFPHWLAWSLVAVAAGAAAVGLHQLGERQQECPGHWHSAFVIVMDGDVVHFTQPVFLRGPGSIKDFDLHADDQVMHYHPQIRDRCTAFSHFLGNLGIELTDHSIAFNEYFGANAGTYLENATHALQVHYQPWNSTWREVRWDDVAHEQLKPGDKILITYGKLTPERVEAQKALVHDLPDHYLPPGYRTDPEAEAPDEHANATHTPG